MDDAQYAIAKGFHLLYPKHCTKAIFKSTGNEVTHAKFKQSVWMILAKEFRAKAYRGREETSTIAPDDGSRKTVYEVVLSKPVIPGRGPAWVEHRLVKLENNPAIPESEKPNYERLINGDEFVPMLQFFIPLVFLRMLEYAQGANAANDMIKKHIYHVVGPQVQNTGKAGTNRLDARASLKIT